MNKLINSETKSKVLNYLRPWNYLGPAPLRDFNANSRWKKLVLMRDLRLWVIENIGLNSSRSQRHEIGIEHLQKEINYIQFRSIIVIVLHRLYIAQQHLPLYIILLYFQI